MKLLTNEQRESYKNAKICYICRGMLEDKHARNKKYHKIWDHYHYTSEYRDTAHSICNLKYSIPKGTTADFHYGWNYDYNFIIKELVEESEGQFTCLGENTE